MNEIVRQPTSKERIDWDGGNIGQKEDIARQRFETELANEFQKAMKKGIPFANSAARAEWNDYYEQQMKENLRKNGFVNASEIKPLKMDWKRYSDISNFELIDEGERSDTNLTKHNPGLNVMVAWKKFKFKGHFHNYTVMESATDAILRARKKLRELEADSGSRKHTNK